MSNRTDFVSLAIELAMEFDLSSVAIPRIETELDA